MTLERDDELDALLRGRDVDHDAAEGQQPGRTTLVEHDLRRAPPRRGVPGRSTLVNDEPGGAGGLDEMRAELMARIEKLQQVGRDDASAKNTPGKNAGPQEPSPTDRRGADDDSPPEAARILSDMSSKFGHSFDGVRLHTGPEAARRTAALGTKAVTIGNDVFFGPDVLDPGSAEGTRVLAHELAHVVQQRHAMPTAQTFTEPVGARGDAFEQEAHRAADAVAAGQRPQIALSTTSAVAQRDEAPPAALTYDAYLAKYTSDIASGVVTAFAGYDVDAQCPFASWKTNGTTVIDKAVKAMTATGFIAALPALTAPDDVKAAIDRGRNAGADGKSEDRYVPAVATELFNILSRRATESVRRLVPLYVRASNQAYRTANLGPVVDPKAPTIDDSPTPAAEDLVLSAPVDKYIGPALLGAVKCDLRNYEKAHPDEKAIQKPRVVNWEFAGGTTTTSKDEGKLQFVRVTDTLDPPVTAEDVALTIYGSSTMATLLTPAPPLWGFSQPELLKPEIHARWLKLPGNDAGDWFAVPKPDDPAKQILSGPGGDQAALAQAAGAPGTDKGDKEAVAKRIRAASLVVDSLLASSKQLDGMGGGDLASLKTRLDDRAKQVEGDTNASGQASPWDAQSAGQLDILGKCSNGLQEAAKSWVALKAGGTGKDSPAGFIADPVKKVATAFTDAAAVSDLVDTGRQRLATANQTLRLYPVDVVEGLLSYIRSLISTASAASNHGGDSELGGEKSISDLGKTETDLRTRCAKLRGLIETDPAAASTELDKIRQEVKDLSDDTTVITLLAKEGELRETLWILQSKLGKLHWSNLNPWSTDTRSKNQKYEDARGQCRDLQSDLDSRVVNVAKAGDRKKAHEGLIAVQAQYKDMFPNIAKLIDDEETREKWISIGVMIGVGILSAGFADAAAAVAVEELGLEGAGLSAFKTAAEAASFTTLTTVTMEKDPTIQGVIADFVKNAVTFGLVSKAMKSYEAALPGFAETSLGKFTGAGGLFVAHCSAGLAAADAKKFLATGQHLTEEEAKDSVLEGVLVSIGTLIGERVTHHMLEGMHLSGSGHIPKDLAKINGERDATKTRAAALEGKGATADAAKAVIEKDGETIKAEKKLLDDLDTAEKDPAAAKAAGLSEADVTAIKAAKGDRDAAATDIDKGKLLQLAASLKPLGGGVFTTEGSGTFDELIAAHNKAKSHVTLTGEPGNRTAVIETADGQTLRVVEDEAGAVAAKPKDAPDPAAPATRAAVEQRAEEKAYTDSKNALLGRMKLNGDHYELDGTGASMPEVVSKLRELGWQTMEVVDKKVAQPDGTTQTLRQARFEANPDPASGKPPYETAPQVISVQETKPFDPKSAPPLDKAKYEAALGAIRAHHVPNPLDLPPGDGNLEGTIKLEKLNRDAFLNSDPNGQKLVDEFYKMLGDRLKAAEDPAKPLADLNKEIQAVMNAKGGDGKPMFLERGPALSMDDAKLMGDLDRVVDFFGLAANKCITQSYYDSLLMLKENQPGWALPAKTADINPSLHAGNIAELMRVQPPDPMTDLDPSRPIGREGAPGWWGAAHDSGNAGPLPAQIDAEVYAKAVAAANLSNGGVLFRIPATDFVSGKVPAMAGHTAVARRPTVFDSLWQNQFNPNPDAAATFGKTTPHPNAPDTKPVREVILPTVTIGQTDGRVLVK